MDSVIRARPQGLARLRPTRRPAEGAARRRHRWRVRAALPVRHRSRACAYGRRPRVRADLEERMHRLLDVLQARRVLVDAHAVYFRLRAGIALLRRWQVPQSQRLLARRPVVRQVPDKLEKRIDAEIRRVDRFGERWSPAAGGVVGEGGLRAGGGRFQDRAPDFDQHCSQERQRRCTGEKPRQYEAMRRGPVRRQSAVVDLLLHDGKTEQRCHSSTRCRPSNSANRLVEGGVRCVAGRQLLVTRAHPRRIREGDAGLPGMSPRLRAGWTQGPSEAARTRQLGGGSGRLDYQERGVEWLLPIPRQRSH